MMKCERILLIKTDVRFAWVRVSVQNALPEGG